MACRQWHAVAEGGDRVYYEDRRTGSLYSAWEVGQLLRDRVIGIEEVGRRFAAVPSDTCLPLEQAVAVAAIARGRRRRRRTRGRPAR